MATIHPSATGRASEPEPLLVRPRVAWRMLGCGNTHGYKLLNAGELKSFLDGKSRKIVVASIHSYIARKLADTKGELPHPRRRGGRARKHREAPIAS